MDFEVCRDAQLDLPAGRRAAGPRHGYAARFRLQRDCPARLVLSGKEVPAAADCRVAREGQLCICRENIDGGRVIMRALVQEHRLRQVELACDDLFLILRECALEFLWDAHDGEGVP